MRKAVRAIIIKDNQLLVMHRNKFGREYDTLPGGGIEIGESPEHAVFREIAEETMLTIANPRLVFIDHAGDMYGDQYIFLCDYVSGEPQLSPDAVETKINAMGQNIHQPLWLPINQLNDRVFLSEPLKQEIIACAQSGWPENPLEFTSTRTVWQLYYKLTIKERVMGKSQRIFALLLAILFIATTFGTIGIVIYQERQNNQQAADLQALQETAQQQSETEQENAQVLEGTKLQNFEPVASVDTLQVIDIETGTGEEVKAGATVTAHYAGAVAADGTIFQSSLDRGEPIEFSLNQVIQGWTQGVPGMKVGGTRRLIIPASLAYGANPPAGSNIPANAPLVFDIKLTAVQNN